MCEDHEEQVVMEAAKAVHSVAISVLVLDAAGARSARPRPYLWNSD